MRIIFHFSPSGDHLKVRFLRFNLILKQRLEMKKLTTKILPLNLILLGDPVLLRP